MHKQRNNMPLIKAIRDTYFNVQNLWAGFGIVTAFALLVLLIMLLVGKPFKK